MAFMPGPGAGVGHSLTLQTGQTPRMRGRGRLTRTISPGLGVPGPDDPALPLTSCVTLGK